MEFVFSVNGQGTNWSDTHTSSIAPGQSVVVTANGGPAGSSTWTPASAGTYSILANVDDVNRITNESNESNNTLTESMTVSSAPTPDTTPPTTPGTPVASNVTASSLNLSWTASTDNIAITGYRLERCTGTNCTNFAQIAAPTTNSYSDTTLSPLTTYRYRVRASDGAGNTSSYSSATSVTTPALGTGWPSGVHASNNLQTNLNFGTWRGRPIEVLHTFTNRNDSTYRYRCERPAPT